MYVLVQGGKCSLGFPHSDEAGGFTSYVQVQTCLSSYTDFYSQQRWTIVLIYNLIFNVTQLINCFQSGGCVYFTSDNYSVGASFPISVVIQDSPLSLSHSRSRSLSLSLLLSPSHLSSLSPPSPPRLPLWVCVYTHECKLSCQYHSKDTLHAADNYVLFQINQGR